MRSLFVAMLCSFVFVGTSLAVDPVPGLIEELASGDYRTREAATKELESIGEPALDALKKAATTHSDPEAARRAAELVARIGKKVDNEKTLAPTLVELSFNDQPLGDVIAALEKQSGYKITHSDPANSPKTANVTVNTAGKVPFWTAIEKLCEVAKLEVTTTDIGVPTDAYTQTGRGGMSRYPTTRPTSVIVLRELKGERKPSFVRGAVRVTVSVLPQAAYATYSKDTIPVVITIQPEPKVRWERLLTVGVLKAKDDGGQELIALSSQDRGPEGMSAQMPGVMPVRGGNIVLGPNGAILVPNQREDLPPQTGFNPLPVQGLARLKVGSEPSKSLMAFQGTVRGTVRTVSEILAVVSGLEVAKNSAPAKGPNGVTLNVTNFVAKVDKSEAYELDAAVSYNPADVQISDTSTMPYNQEMVMIQGGGRVIVRRQVGGGFNPSPANLTPVTQIAGLTVLDAEGHPYLLTAASYRRQVESDGRTTDSLKLTIKPSDKTTGKPAVLAFSATRAKTVEFPFELCGVPVSSGLGPIDSPRPSNVPAVIPR